MNDDIKEILNKLKDSVDNPIDTEVDQFTQEAYDVPNFLCLDPTTNDCKLLLDYITNLQETIDFQDKWLEYYKDFISENNIKDYKSRIEKAVEILKDTNVDMPITLLIETIDNGINILNGRSDE